MKADVKTDNYRLIELGAENFKRLRAVRIRADGRVIQITGKNGQGKSSVLDILPAVLGGKALCPAEPIRKGETQGECYVDLGGMRVTRKFWVPTGKSKDPYHTELVIEFQNGQRPKKPQDFLKSLGGTDIGADPIEFIRMAPKAQYDVLKALVPGFDFEDNAASRLALEQERVLAGRDRDRATGAAQAIQVDATVGDKTVDVSALIAEVREATKANVQRAERALRRRQTADDAEAKRNEADVLRARAKALDAEADALEVKLNSADPLPAEISTADLERRIEESERTNQLVRLVQDRNTYREEANVAAKRWLALQDDIKALDAAKVKAIADAKLPVAGLEFGDEVILLGGVPFGQASMAEQLRACVAIEMARKPEIRVLAIHDGSLLDEDSLKLIDELAEEHDFWVLLERVSNGEKIGVVIENGEVRP